MSKLGNWNSIWLYQAVWLLPTLLIYSIIFIPCYIILSDVSEQMFYKHFFCQLRGNSEYDEKRVGEMKLCFRVNWKT